MKIVIMAGGTGTRFWPLSRSSKPKQFSSIVAEKSMIEITFDRFNNIYHVDDLYVSTTPAFEGEVLKALPEMNKENIIVEPEKRDTAAAMGFVAAKLFNIAPDEPIAFICSDHYIANVDKFLKSLKVAEELIRTEGKMLDIAINPNFPSTALGYTKIGEKYKEVNEVEVYKFLDHVEKPDFDKAKEYIEEGNYLWHASFYMWTPRKILEAFKAYAPDLFKHLDKITNYLKEGESEKVIEEYGKMEKISFDYAVTEKMDPEDVLIIKGDFGWSDIGAWDVLYDQLQQKADKEGNVVRGQWVGDDTNNCLIYGKDKKTIATIGLDNMVVVDTDDALLICPQGRAQDVKKIVKKLEEAQREDIL